MQSTPLCGPKIGAISKGGFGTNVVAIYDGGAADGQPVRRHPITPVPCETSVQNLSPRLYGFVSGHVRPDLRQSVGTVVL